MQFQEQTGAPGKKHRGAKLTKKKDERCAMQFQVKVGAPEKKTSGAPN